MVSPITYPMRQKRRYSAHHKLLEVAGTALDAAKTAPAGSKFDQYEIAMTFSALAFEALTNLLVQRLVDDPEDYGSSSPIAKIRAVWKELGLPYEKDDPIWADLRTLFRFRNQVAHAKPEDIDEVNHFTDDDFENPSLPPPQSALEKMVTQNGAERAVAVVRTFLERAYQKTQSPLQQELVGGSYSTEPAKP
ncbi:hypothetical protein X551_02382 [Methylibium sp. T29]|nr:hypothetical protein X551_02382 [Methylibium sp. T29]EWS61511.1 hypothetical protein Y694_00785 [Methylibium sp. T29-B]